MRRATSNAGFSTLEMIVTTLILGLSMILVANGASAVQRIYRRTLAKADAQMIYSQIETNLRAELAFANKVDKFSDVKQYVIGDVTYQLRLDNAKVLYADFTYPPPPAVVATNYHNALSPTNLDRLESMTIIEPTITYNKDNGYFTVSGLQVKYGDQNMIDADTPSFMIRAANEVTEITASPPSP